MDENTKKVIEEVAEQAAGKTAEKMEAMERRLGAKIESVEQKVEGVADGVQMNSEKLDRLDERLEKMEGADLDTRVKILEQRAEA